MLKFSIGIILICSFIGCKKDVGFPGDPKHPTCPVAHEHDISKAGTMKDKWKFVGFQKENSEEIESPPCDVLMYDIYGAPFTWSAGAEISFPDTLTYYWYNNTMLAAYPSRYEGYVLNRFFGGSGYDGTNLALGSVMLTLAGGPEPIMDFEDKFHFVLKGAKTYQIHHNILTINCGGSGKMLFVLK